MHVKIIKPLLEHEPKIVQGLRTAVPKMFAEQNTFYHRAKGEEGRTVCI